MLDRALTAIMAFAPPPRGRIPRRQVHCRRVPHATDATGWAQVRADQGRRRNARPRRGCAAATRSRVSSPGRHIQAV